MIQQAVIIALSIPYWSALVLHTLLHFRVGEKLDWETIQYFYIHYKTNTTKPVSDLAN